MSEPPSWTIIRSIMKYINKMAPLDDLLRKCLKHQQAWKENQVQKVPWKAKLAEVAEVADIGKYYQQVPEDSNSDRYIGAKIRNSRKKEHKKLEKYYGLKEELEKMWKVKGKVVPVVLGALGAVPPKIGEWIKQIPGMTSEHSVQKSALLGTVYQTESRWYGTLSPRVIPYSDSDLGHSCCEFPAKLLGKSRKLLRVLRNNSEDHNIVKQIDEMQRFTDQGYPMGGGCYYGNLDPRLAVVGGSSHGRDKTMTFRSYRASWRPVETDQSEDGDEEDQTDVNGLESLGWYHDNLSRHAAEALLLTNGQDGSYLLRKSDSNAHNIYSLSVRAKESVKHFQVIQCGSSFKFGFNEFATVKDFIEHFANQPLIGSESGTLILLKFPYPREVEEPSIYESVRVHTAMQTGRSESDLMPVAPSLGTKEGYLTKQGGRVKNWKTRWFILQRNELKYFKDQISPEPIRTLDLTECSAVQFDYSQEKVNCFCLVFPLRTYYLCAKTGAEADEWIKILRWKMYKIKKQSTKL
ncbi:dual adapter for phosphotyrosine and 3-phosphotyrosine and 3-phosphoinositide [Pelodytes ibericus]